MTCPGTGIKDTLRLVRWPLDMLDNRRRYSVEVTRTQELCTMAKLRGAIAARSRTVSPTR
jgi:hypothetical protein